MLDLSRLLPGGFCSLLLADFGADVVKVEDAGMGDYIRWSPPFYEGAPTLHESARSALFLALNRNKRSIRIDLKQERGREVLLRLVREHDVLLESFRPGVLDRLGVGYERLREEMALGKSLKVALETAYEKAFSSIFDAKLPILIALFGWCSGMFPNRLTTRSLKSLDPTSPRATVLVAAPHEAAEAHSLDLP